jgi:hypothetical protein
MVKVNEIGKIKQDLKTGKNVKPTKKQRKALKDLRKFKRNNS